MYLAIAVSHAFVDLTFELGENAGQVNVAQRIERDHFLVQADEQVVDTAL